MNPFVLKAKEHAMNMALTYPSLKSEINYLVQLMMDEIASGEPATNEASLCIASIDELIEDNY
jgi:hypothetical protein